VIATLVRQATEHGFEVRIVTSDKDARQLLGPHVQIYNIRKNTFYDENSLKQEWGIRPDQVVDFQSLVGDSIDNVPGIPLIGAEEGFRPASAVWNARKRARQRGYGSGRPQAQRES
jgi:DNA polymerase-1